MGGKHSVHAAALSRENLFPKETFEISKATRWQRTVTRSMSQGDTYIVCHGGTGTGGIPRPWVVPVPNSFSCAPTPWFQGSPDSGAAGMQPRGWSPLRGLLPSQLS